MLKLWLLPAAAIVTVFGISYVLPSPAAPVSEASVQTFTNSFIGPSVTIIGLFITFVPLIGFFLVNQLKEQRKDFEADIAETEESAPEICKNCEAKELVKQSSKIVGVYYKNFTVGVLKYVETFSIVAISSLLFVPLLYFSFNSRNFLSVDFLLLGLLACGVYPVVSVALHKQPVKLTEDQNCKEIKSRKKQIEQLMR